MAFAKSELAQMAYTGANGGNAFWFYSNTNGDTVTASGFFNDAAEELSEGDLVFDVDGVVFYSVSDIASGVVTVAAVHDTPA